MFVSPDFKVGAKVSCDESTVSNAYCNRWDSVVCLSVCLALGHVQIDQSTGWTAEFRGSKNNALDEVKIERIHSQPPANLLWTLVVIAIEYPQVKKIQVDKSSFCITASSWITTKTVHILLHRCGWEKSDGPSTHFAAESILESFVVLVLLFQLDHRPLRCRNLLLNLSVVVAFIVKELCFLFRLNFFISNLPAQLSNLLEEYTTFKHHYELSWTSPRSCPTC